MQQESDGAVVRGLRYTGCLSTWDTFCMSLLARWRYIVACNATVSIGKAHVYQRNVGHGGTARKFHSLSCHACRNASFVMVTQRIVLGSILVCKCNTLKVVSYDRTTSQHDRKFLLDANVYYNGSLAKLDHRVFVLWHIVGKGVSLAHKLAMIQEHLQAAFRQDRCIRSKHGRSVRCCN